MRKEKAKNEKEKKSGCHARPICVRGGGGALERKEEKNEEPGMEPRSL
jgi:hypothetical protein